MGKRLNGESSVRPFRKDEKGKGKMWCGSVMVGHRPDGKPDLRYMHGSSAAEVRKKLETVKHERTTAGDAWKEQTLMFSSEVGTTLNYSNLRRAFLTLCARAEVSPIHIHDLRHTAASAMIRAEFPVKLVAARLGHTDPAFTLRVYAHVWAEHRHEYAASVEDLYGPRAAAPLLN